MGLVITLTLVSETMVSKSSPVQSLTYTQFENDVTANQVKTATIGASGGVTGLLTDGKKYKSQIPVVPPQNTLAALLSAHNVDVTGTTASNGVSIGSIILDLLPFIFFIGFFVWIGRRARKSLGGLGGGLGGVMGIGSSRAKVYDEERPETTFADVAGYEERQGRGAGGSRLPPKPRSL